MTKYCLFLFIILSTALAYAAPDPYAHLMFYYETDKTFFQKIANNEEATYMICVGPNSIGKHLTKETA